MEYINYFKINQSMLIYKQYERLINAYILDFYIENNWNLLPDSWKEFFGSITFPELAQILNYEKKIESNKIIPLSVLALITLLGKFNFPRQGNPIIYSDALESLPGFKIIKSKSNMFWKHIKLKKRHEIMTMSQVTYNCAKTTNCLYIVDIGSGLGHFSRALSYMCGLKTLGIEMKETLTKQATQLDRNFENSSKELWNNTSPIHITKRIDENISRKEFIYTIATAFGFKTEEFRFGIVGLHPCGDLGPVLLRIFNNCPQAKFINIVGCCYMKLSTTTSQPRRFNSRNMGFPMSEYCIKNNYSLNYNSLEVACHAIENYVDKLRSGDIDDLKIHSYRAVLEKLLKIHRPEFCHRQLANVKYKNNLKFQQYCQNALHGYPDISIEDHIINSMQVQEDLKKWPKVVVFYSLRLLFAPLIESIVLYDRLLFLTSNAKCEIIPKFDPRVSPRNQVLTAIKE